MSLWKREGLDEEKAFKDLPLDRQANIEIVSSAYTSVFCEKAYLTMPVTTGKRFYDILDRFGVKTIDELEKKMPGALREEIILPNTEEGRVLANRIQPQISHAVICPGVFEGRKQKWSQEEYMILWLRLITSSASSVYLSDGWEYSNGGARELVRSLAIHYGIVGGRGLFNDFRVYDHLGNEVEVIGAAWKLASAIKDLDKRGFDTNVLRRELASVAGITFYGADFARTTYHLDKVWQATQSVNVGTNVALEGL